MDAATTVAVPTLEGTYYAGSTFQLYPHPGPPSPGRLSDLQQLGRYEEGAKRMVEIEDRYKKSISESRFASDNLHSPDVSISLVDRLHSVTGRIPHVWTAQAGLQGDSPRLPSLLVAKIFDPVFFDSGEAYVYDPFLLRDLSVFYEMESYNRLEDLQGSEVPQYYGHFITPIPSQHNRIVNVILMEYVHPGKNLRALVPVERAEDLCAVHREAAVEAVVRLWLKMYARGVSHSDVQPRNVILRSPNQHPKAGTTFCAKEECPLRLEAGLMHEALRVVSVDFELVDLVEKNLDFLDSAEFKQLLEQSKEEFRMDWFRGLA